MPKEGKDGFTVYITNIVPYLKDHDIQESVYRIIDRTTLLKVETVSPTNCKSSNFILHLKTESAQKRLFHIKRLYVKEYVLRMEPSNDHPDVEVYRRRNPPRLKLTGLPPYLKPCDLKELCLDANAIFWEIPWSTRLKRYENFAIVEFDKIEDCMTALNKPISLDGKPLTWLEVGGILRRQRSPELREDISDPINAIASGATPSSKDLTAPNRSSSVIGSSGVAASNPWNLTSSSLNSYEAMANKSDATSRHSEPLIVNSTFLGKKRDNQVAFHDEKTFVTETEKESHSQSKQRRLLEEESKQRRLGDEVNLRNEQPIHPDFMLKLLDRIAAMQSEYLERTQNMVEKNMNQLNQIYSILLEQSKFQEKMLSHFTQLHSPLSYGNNSNNDDQNESSNALKSKAFLSSLESTFK